MIEGNDRIHPLDIVQATITNRYAIPLFLSLVQCSFTSPAESYIQRRLDLNELCNIDSEGTYFARAMGESLIGDRIYPGDILVVDSMREPVTGDILVVWRNGDYCATRSRSVFHGLPDKNTLKRIAVERLDSVIPRRRAFGCWAYRCRVSRKKRLLRWPVDTGVIGFIDRSFLK